VDVYKRALKTFVDASGRTVVHFKACPFIGTDNFCENSVLCAKRHQSASIETRIISNSRKGFEEVGTNGNYDPLTLQGDPTSSHLIASYVTFKRTQQGLSGVLPKSAATMEKTNQIDHENYEK